MSFKLAYLPAHEQYLKGELENTSCIDCHADVGHGDQLEGVITEYWQKSN
jgi:nitrate/TMAO reductase-like tetraheme cytochrome c subunit